MRKSTRIGALLVGTALTTAVLSGCDDSNSPPPTPPPAQTKIFPSLQVCVEEADSMEEVNDCKTAFSEAEKEHVKTAPEHSTAASCESVYGKGNCVPKSSIAGAPAASGGSDPFVPMMVGFMLGQALDGGGTRVVHHYPVYRDAGGYTYARNTKLSVPPMRDDERRDRVIVGGGSIHSGGTVTSSGAWSSVSKAESRAQADTYRAQTSSYKSAVTASRGGFGSTGARAAVSSGG